MDDREMLELAAKAAEVEIRPHPNHKLFQRDLLFISGGRNWNPLTDDGDEARLEAALGLNVEWDDICVTVGGVISSDGDTFGGELEAYHEHNGNKQAARRRAGVRAAAEIGKAMK